MSDVVLPVDTDYYNTDQQKNEIIIVRKNTLYKFNIEDLYSVYIDRMSKGKKFIIPEVNDEINTFELTELTEKIRKKHNLGDISISQGYYKLYIRVKHLLTKERNEITKMYIPDTSMLRLFHEFVITYKDILISTFVIPAWENNELPQNEIKDLIIECFKKKRLIFEIPMSYTSHGVTERLIQHAITGELSTYTTFCWHSMNSFYEREASNITYHLKMILSKTEEQYHNYLAPFKTSIRYVAYEKSL